MEANQKVSDLLRMLRKLIELFGHVYTIVEMGCVHDARNTIFSPTNRIDWADAI